MNYTTTEWNNKKVILGEPELDPEQPARLVIGFHGAESTPENMLVHATRATFNNVLQVIPEAPIDAGKGLWSWWMDGPKQKETVGEFLQFTEATLASALEWAAGKASSIEVCLWGFSQGGAAALVYSLLGNQTVHRSASICGFLPEMPESDANGKNPGNILGIYGLNDDVVPSFLAEYALDEIRNQGHAVRILETQQGHEVTPENLREIALFFG